jgi:dihydrofolate reductase
MISIIVAISKNNCIGKDGQLPWHIPEDMKHFKKITMNKTVVMGRKTWASIPDRFRPLPGRKNVVITRQKDYAVPEGVEVFNSLDVAFEQHKSEKIIIIGGGEIYRQSLDKADRLYVTQIDQEVESCDAFFPEINSKTWKETERQEHQGFTFVTYKRRTADL